jgi:hypothetical protein
MNSLQKIALGIDHANKARMKGGKLKQTYMPPDHGDICWTEGAETFTRKEVADLLWTQRAMIGNDLKSYCGNELTKEMFEILDNPRIPKF